ncbi:hypothetical protein C172_04738 [Paenibacillus sp. FSL H8-457]|nr:hypothetical protein C172_04738 [Paenibacillus sp. FSL H8-457]
MPSDFNNEKSNQGKSEGNRDRKNNPMISIQKNASPRIRAATEKAELMWRSGAFTFAVGFQQRKFKSVET